MTASNAELAIARAIARLQRETRSQARASQAALRSVELSDGPVSYYGEDGEERLVVGPQGEDGIYTVQETNSEWPPVPETPDVVNQPGAIAITHDGTFVDANTPVNFAYFEIHASQTPGYFADDSTQIGTFSSPQGGTFTFASAFEDGDWYISIQTVNRSGIESDKSEEVVGRGAGYPLPVLTDPPSVSPAVEVTGTTTSLIAHTEDVAAGTTIQYHISTTDGFVPTLSGVTMFTETEATVALIDAMPDGTPLSVDGQYFVRTIAYNSLGSAAPSAQAPAALDMNNVDEFVTAKLVAAFIQAGKISVGQFTLDSVGMRVNRPGGGYVFNFPFSGTDTLELTAAVTAVSLNVLNALTIQGSGNLYGTLLMANGIVAPTNQPGVSRTWPSNTSVQGDGTADVSNVIHGLIEDPANNAQFVQCMNYFGPVIRYMNKTTGAWAGDMDLSGVTWDVDFYPNGGITYLGGSFFIIGSDNARSGDFYIFKFSATTGAKQAEIRLGDLYMFQGADPRIFTSGATISFAFINSSKDLRVKEFDAGLAAQVNNTILPGVFPGRYHIGDVVYGNFDGVGTRAYISLRGTNNVLCYNPTGWARDATHDFQRASTVQGMCYDAIAGQMVSMDSTGIMARYGKYPVDKAITAKYAWLDADITGGTHETQPGPVTAYTIPARTYLNLQAVEPPDYLNTDPANTDKANQVAMYATDDGGATWRKQIYTASPWGGSYATLVGLATGVPKVTNEFLASTVATPGVLKSTAVDGDGSLIDLTGAGSGRIGPWKFGVDGKTLVNNGSERSGTLIMWTANSVPLDCVQASGQAVSRPISAGGTVDTFKNLWDLYGTTYGAGDGTTTFNVPNFDNKVPRGISGDPRGVTGGADAVTMPNHLHWSGAYVTSTPTNAPMNTWVTPNTGSNAVSRSPQVDAHQHNVTGQSGDVVSPNPSIPTIPAFSGVKMVIKL